MAENKKRKELEEWVTVKEASRIMRMTDRWVRELINKGELEARKLGNMWLVSRESIYEYLRRDFD